MDYSQKDWTASHDFTSPMSSPSSPIMAIRTERSERTVLNDELKSEYTIQRTRGRHPVLYIAIVLDCDWIGPVKKKEEISSLRQLSGVKRRSVGATRNGPLQNTVLDDPRILASPIPIKQRVHGSPCEMIFYKFDYVGRNIGEFQFSYMEV
ncbi:hypothetical protein EVAR_21190_1 [Eumeta japonica]|uniref:Uncharacterized protein n=1 Tax=Eumeta variegata TaxID=151549 RepID=A0A4C1UPC5_EUMVA|nr:hypothetical protein EVAR_21190_1 [Eumeta japonica]